MVFICDLNANVYTLASSTLNQGSSNASEIVLLAPYSGASAVSLAVIPPSGKIGEPIILKKADVPEGLPDNLQGLTAWSARIPAAFTEYPGDITFQFFITNGGEKISLGAVTKHVNAGVPYLDLDFSGSVFNFDAASEMLSAAQSAASEAGRAESEAKTAAATAAKDAANAVKSELSGYVSDVTEAKGAAEAASKGAIQAYNDAETARRDAIAAQGAAETARNEAETARNEAQTIKNSLETDVKAYIDTRFGDVTSVFDSIHEYAESVIGGDAQ